jgi:excisionase family DNA binding protein
MSTVNLENTAAVPRLLTLSAVAEALAVSPHTVRMWVRKGKLKPIRICRRLLFNPVEVNRFLSGDL